jgi:hypothetical protein
MVRNQLVPGVFLGEKPKKNHFIFGKSPPLPAILWKIVLFQWSLDPEKPIRAARAP